LKLASYYRSRGHTIRLVRGNRRLRFQPDKVLITSVFTYWQKYVWDSVKFYKERYPNARVIVGGIYASLMPEQCMKSGCDEVFVGVHKSAEKCKPAYDLLKVDYQIIHTSRGCIRKCKFCGVYRIETALTFKKSIKKEIHSNKLVFYDNNVTANPYFANILKELAELRQNGKSITCESQCGFDGRLLTPVIAKMIKQAGFQYPKIAWDGLYSQHKAIRKQLDLFLEAGYNHRDISVFMLYNWDLDFLDMEKKRIKCWKWGVQISDCRYRPLDQLYDNYAPTLKQTNEDYHIHHNWTDAQVKQFRKNVREQNICVRHRFPFYSKSLEKKEKYVSKKNGQPIDAWYPNEIRPPEKDILQTNYYR
jgi:hypothetical protein